ncbi:MAG: protein phosphatase 2C domain-containing protein [Acidobacteriota bacterium]
MELKVGQVCDRGLNPRRPVNQDRLLMMAERGLFAVFDGVGGQRAGEVASQTAADTIEETLAHTQAASPVDLIRRAIEFANRDIFEMAAVNPEYRTMATTVALVHLNHNHATIAHVGDSRVYRFEDGLLVLETIDHTDLNDDLRAGRITRSQAASQADRNVINRALGVEMDVEAEIKTIPIREGARFLLCSDGIYKHLDEDEIAHILSANDDPQRAADELKRIVYERGADDNLTAIIVEVGRAQKALARKSEKAISAVKAAQSGAAVAARANRIEVDFGEPARVENRTFKQLDPTTARISFDEPQEETSKTKKIMRALIAIVLLAAAFYAGLRASEFFKKKTSDARPITIEVAEPMQLGREAFDKRDYQRAAAEFDSAIRREPSNAEARYWLGRAQLEQGEYEKASQNFEEAIRLQPAMSDAYLQAAASYSIEGKRDKSEKMLRQYAERRRAERAR